MADVVQHASYHPSSVVSVPSALTCSCGFALGQLPDLETTVDVLMEHAFDAGLTAGDSSRG